MRLHEYDLDGLVYVTVRGEIEPGPLGEALRARIRDGSSRILIELEADAVVTGTVIGLLLDLQRGARAAGGGVVLVRPPRLLRKSLALLGATAHLPSVDTADEAAALLPRRPDRKAASALVAVLLLGLVG